MSVALLVKTTEGGNSYLPLCTEKIKVEFLLPKIRELNVFWLTRLRPGISINAENLESLIQELTLLKEHVEIDNTELSIFVCQRITGVINRLEACRQTSFEGYLG